MNDTMNDLMINTNDDSLFHCTTTEYNTVDYENMAHEAAIQYFNFKISSHKVLLPSDYAKAYLTIYKEILTGLQESE